MSSTPAKNFRVITGGIAPNVADVGNCRLCAGPSLYVVQDEGDLQKRLARAIREAMDSANLTPPKLAALLGVAPKTVNRWINEEAVPSALSIRPLANALGVSPMLFVDPPPVPAYPLSEYLVRQATVAGLEEGLNPRPRRRRAAGGASDE